MSKPRKKDRIDRIHLTVELTPDQLNKLSLLARRTRRTAKEEAAHIIAEHLVAQFSFEQERLTELSLEPERLTGGLSLTRPAIDPNAKLVPRRIGKHEAVMTLTIPVTTTDDKPRRKR